MAMAEGKCRCNEGNPGVECPVCRMGEQPDYWCDTCRQAVTGKRCPLCGLKARKMREGKNGG